MFSLKKTVNIKGTLKELVRTNVMGVLNVTPDSFFDGGQYTREKAILTRVEHMLQEGADFIDVGGASTRPGAKAIAPQEELRRVIPAIRCILKAFPDALLSIDTFCAEVAMQALEEGAIMINDISGGQLDKDMFSIAAKYRVPYVLTHMRGTPKTMQSMTDYDELLGVLTDYFCKNIDELHRKGVADIIIDPGIGFAKTRMHNFNILKHLPYLHVFDKPLMVGVSRKSLIWKTLRVNPEQALNGSTVLHTIAVLKGAHFLRVHDVKEAVEVIKLVNFMQ